MKYNLKNEAAKLLNAAIHADITSTDSQNKGETLNDLLENGLKSIKDGNFAQCAKDIGIDISKPSEEVKVDQKNFIELQGEATMIRTLQIRLLMSGETTENQIKAFEASDLYKKCKAIENGLEGFKREKFGDEMPNFSGSLKSEDLEIGESGELEIIKKKITEATETLEKDNSLKSLELNSSNRDKITMMALNSSPIGLGLANSSEKGIEVMKETPFKMKAARLGAIVGLLAAIAVVTAVVSGIAVPSMAAAFGGTKAAGIGATIVGSVVIAATNMSIGSKVPEVNKIGSEKEENQNMSAKADKIKKIKVDDKLSKGLLKDLQKQAKEYEKTISQGSKQQIQI